MIFYNINEFKLNLFYFILLKNINFIKYKYFTLYIFLIYIL